MHKNRKEEFKSKEENEFRKWYTRWATIMGINFNPDLPEHYYDYRKAFRARTNPKYDKETGKYHWPSKFKKLKHPNRFVNGIDTIRNKPIIKIKKKNSENRKTEVRKGRIISKVVIMKYEIGACRTFEMKK
jgi:hypothetical protein